METDNRSRFIRSEDLSRSPRQFCGCAPGLSRGTTSKPRRIPRILPAAFVKGMGYSRGSGDAEYTITPPVGRTFASGIKLKRDEGKMGNFFLFTRRVRHLPRNLRMRFKIIIIRLKNNAKNDTREENCVGCAD